MQGKEMIGIAEKKNTFILSYNDTELTVSGNFESGNLNWAGIDEEKNEIQLQFGKDKQIKPSKKCWFYFSIEGEYQYLPVKLLLMQTNSLNMAAKFEDLYRPVVRVEGGTWERHNSPVQFDIDLQNQINFRMNLELSNSKKIYVALCYPWSTKDNLQYFEELESGMKMNDIYYNRQTLILSPQNRPLHLIAISSQQVQEHQPQDYIQHLFPFRETQSHYKMIKKPMVLITCRVHPGEIGSSFSLIGIIEFLTSATPQSNKILNQFYFLIVPILNPDGVDDGNNRMDALGQNLNRFYLFPDIEKQPSCYAVKALVQNTRDQLFAFFDLHGHSNKKSCFLFGNSISNMELQAQSVLFAKFLSEICQYIEFKSCNFSQKQMSSKDKNEDYSKEGCARVVVHKWTKSPYCYTLETGLFKNVRIDEEGMENFGEEFYNPRIYGEVGKALLISLYAIFKKEHNIQLMKNEVDLYMTKLEKINKKYKDKEYKKKLKSMKSMKKEEAKEEMLMDFIKQNQHNQHFMEISAQEQIQPEND